MGSVRTVNKSNKLFFDFRYNGYRCREYTNLDDTKTNRERLERVLRKIEKEIENGIFDYSDYFPNSKNLKRVTSSTGNRIEPSHQTASANVDKAPVVESVLPNFRNFLGYLGLRKRSGLASQSQKDPEGHYPRAFTAGVW